MKLFSVLLFELIRTRERRERAYNGQDCDEDEDQSEGEEEADEAYGCQEARHQASLSNRGSSVRRRPRLGTRAEQRTSSLQQALRLVFEAGDRDRVSGLRILDAARALKAMPSTQGGSKARRQPAILEKSATLRVAARISERRARRLARRRSASCTPVTLTVTLSKKASTGARSSASARMAPAKFSTLMAAVVSAFTFWIVS